MAKQRLYSTQRVQAATKGGKIIGFKYGCHCYYCRYMHAIRWLTWLSEIGRAHV